MTKEERKAQLRRIMQAAKGRGWTGGDSPTKSAEFVEWAEDNGIEFESRSTGKVIDLKALVIEQPAENQVVITEVDDEPTDEAAMDEEMDDEEPKAVQRSARQIRNEVKKYKADLELLRTQVRDLQKNSGTAGVSVKSAEESAYEADIKWGRSVFSSYANAKGFVKALQIGAKLQAKDFDGARDARKGLIEFMDRAGLETKGYATTPLSAGGALIPEQFIPDLIHLIEEYGDTRALCNVITMTSDTAKRPRATGKMGLYYPGEGGTATESTIPFDLVTLNAKKGVAFTKLTSEILEDDAVGLADFVAREIGRTVAFTEDNTWANGDGSAGTASDRYIPNSRGYLDLFGATATSDARSHTGADTADAHDIGDLTALMAKLPRWARNGAVFVCSPEIDAVTFQRLGITEVGGLTATEFQGQTVMAFRGYPIVHVATMPTAIDASGDQVDILFGNFQLSNMLGMRRSLEMATSDQRYFETDEIAMRGIVRHDFNIHDLGSTTVQSPVVALYQT